MKIKYFRLWLQDVWEMIKVVRRDLLPLETTSLKPPKKIFQ